MAGASEPGYRAQHFNALLDICRTPRDSEARDLALKSDAAATVRRSTASNQSTNVFKARVGKLCINDSSLCALMGGLFVPVFPVESWPLLRALAVLSVSAKDYHGRSISKRIDKEALYQHSSVLFCACASGTGGSTPFGAITIGGVSFKDALLRAPSLWTEFLAGPARYFIGCIPRSLVRPIFDAGQVNSFMNGDRDSLLLPVGQKGRIMLRDNGASGAPLRVQNCFGGGACCYVYI